MAPAATTTAPTARAACLVLLLLLCGLGNVAARQNRLLLKQMVAQLTNMTKLQAERHNEAKDNHDEVMEKQNELIKKQQQAIDNQIEIIAKIDLLIEDDDCPPAQCPQPTTSSLGGAACDLATEFGPWTIVQRRSIGDVLFDKPWATYQAGFGSLSGDYWVGNDGLHELCPPERPCLVRFEFTWPGDVPSWSSVARQPSGRYVAQYNSFSVAGPGDLYRLTIANYDSTASTASDDMIRSYSLNGMAFSTYDADHDPWNGVNCPSAWGGGGGWWYRRCQNANLNGAWGVGNKNGLRWYGVTESDSATSSRIMVRAMA